MNDYVTLNIVVRYYPSFNRYVVFFKNKCYSFRDVESAVGFLRKVLLGVCDGS